MLGHIRCKFDTIARQTKISGNFIEVLAGCSSQGNPAPALLQKSKSTDQRKASSFSGIKTNDSAMEVDPAELPITPWVRSEQAHEPLPFPLLFPKI
jgi:hypothetical protein